jgi:hypothetical protein
MWHACDCTTVCTSGRTMTKTWLTYAQAGERFSLSPNAMRRVGRPLIPGLTAAGARSRPGAIESGASADAQFNRTERISCEKRFIGNKLAL